MTENEAIVGLSFLLGVILTIVIISLTVYVLLIIAMWKIFTKAGEKGWKSLIPLYNGYIYYKIAGMKNYFWIIICAALVYSILQTVTQQNSTLMGIVGLIYGIFTIVIGIIHSYKLSKAFDKGIGYTLGLIFLPNIFTLILGFGKAKYVVNKE